jgi:hypothetical protein
MIICMAKHGPATRTENDITDNILKHSIRCESGLGSTIVKFRHEWLHTGGRGSLNFYLLVIETDRTCKFFFHSPPLFLSLSLNFWYSPLCCFYLSLIYERNDIFYKLIILMKEVRKYCNIYSKSILIFISRLQSLLLSLDL